MTFCISCRRIALALIVLAPATAHGQAGDSVRLSTNYWWRIALGATTSVLMHEAAHIITAAALGGHPQVGFDEARPTIYSGIDSHVQPHKQFLFSASGLTMQSLIDEAILDIPHTHGSAIERGVLGGGIGTTVFYLTIGRRGSVSDVTFMVRSHAMTATQITLLFGSVAALHTLRVTRDKHYANFFVRPRTDGRVDIGVNISDL